MKHCGVRCGPYWTRRLGKKVLEDFGILLAVSSLSFSQKEKGKKSLRSSSKVSITVQDKGLLLQGDCYPALIIIFSEEASLFQLWTPSISVMDAFFLLLLVTDYCKVGSDTVFENYSEMSHLKFWILVISPNFCPIKTDLSGNTVWPQASVFQKLAKMDHLRHF